LSVHSRRVLRALVCLVAGHACPARAADAPALLQGTVEDARTGQGLAEVTVVVLPADGSTLSVVADAQGRFTLAGISPGPATVIIFGRGVAQSTREDTLAPGPARRRYLVSAHGSLDELVVVTAPGGAAQPVETVVEVEEARRVAGARGDPLQVVSSLPGVARPAPGASGVVIWGAAPDESRTLVDGVEVPSLYHLGGVRGVVAPDLVGRIELVPGAYDASYGRALGGLVRVATADLPSDRVHGTIAADAFDATASLAGPLSSRLRVAVGGRYGYLDRLASGLVDEAAAALYPLPRYRDHQAKATLDLRPGEQLGLSLLGARDDLRTALDARDRTAARIQTSTLDWQRLGLHYTRRLEDATSVAATGFVGTTRAATATRSGAAAAGEDRRDLAGGLRATYRAPLTDAAGLTLGVDALVTRSRRERAGTLTIPPREGDLSTFGQPPGDDFNRDRWTVSGGDVALFASLALRRGRWTLVPELRLEAFPLSGSRLLPPVGATPPIGHDRLEGAADPRGSLVFQLRPSLALGVAGGIYHQPADPADLSAVFGAPGLGPSRAVHAAVGLWWRSALATMELTLFGRVATDLVVRSDLPDPPLAGALVQGGRGRSYGAQLLVRRELPARLSGWLAYTVGRTERAGPAGGYRLADFDQTHVLTAVASWRIDARGGWLVGGRARIASGAPRTPVVGASYDLRDGRWDPVFGAHNGIRLPPFFEIDLRLERRVALGGAEIALFLQVENATNHDNREEVVYSGDYRSSGYIRGLPILGFAGARWRF
jgi:hypothetical protein